MRSTSVRSVVNGSPLGGLLRACCCMRVSARKIDSPVSGVPARIDADVLILPREISDDRGLYDDSVLTLAKDLREAGITAEYQHPAEAREWIGERGVDILVAFIVGIASNAGWAALGALLRQRHAGDPVRVRAARISDREAGVDWEWFEVEGPGEDVADALEALRHNGGEAEEH
jgi:hypothetical protein